MKKSVRYAALLSSLFAGTYYGASAKLYAADAAVAANAGSQTGAGSTGTVEGTARPVAGTATHDAAVQQPVVSIAEKPAPKPLPEQWYTGSLYSPSPALPAPGMIAVEPYVAAGLPAGAFDSNGHLNTRKGAGGQHSISQFSLAKYGITDHLSIYLLPTYSYSWGNHTKHSGLKFNDLPVEFQYRLTPHYTPSITLYFGVNTPTGDYKNLSNASEGVGQGVWALRYGVHSQFALPFFSHAMRVRLWAQVRHPVASTKLRNITSYGTEKGFTGRGHAGPYGNEGGSVELGITKKWVFALDLYHTWATSSSVNGYNVYSRKYINSRTGWSGAFNVGPGIEYNWTSSVGGIVGVILPVAGHNTSRSISPEAAVFAVF
ncbi:hypothetical protein [Bombella mellum]|uniref:Transporter n=1 Tax=Bombella mellum TaxID=2039288 RepID=A0ABR5ZU64_9PROT|nr:hypothetical protein [Bombella mellum]